MTSQLLHWLTIFGLQPKVVSKEVTKHGEDYVERQIRFRVGADQLLVVVDNTDFRNTDGPCIVTPFNSDEL